MCGRKFYQIFLFSARGLYCEEKMLYEFYYSYHKLTNIFDKMSATDTGGGGTTGGLKSLRPMSTVLDVRWHTTEALFFQKFYGI